MTRPGNPSRVLSLRQAQVIRLVAAGKSNQEIADQLGVARSTVEAHTAAVFQKFGVHNRTAAVSVARDRGYISKDAVLS